MTQRILVVDDDREIVELLRAYLEQSGYQVLVAHGGEMALQILRREQPDLVLLDLMLPEADRSDVTGVVRGDVGLAAMPIIMLDAHVKARDEFAGPEQGVDRSATQLMNPRELVAGVQAVLRRARGKPAPPKLIHAGNLVIDLDRRQAQVGDQPVHLTPTELGLLQALAERPGYTLTRLEMMEEGLGHSYEGVDRTVDSHVKNLRRKLAQAGARAGMVETVFGVGYRLSAARPRDTECHKDFRGQPVNRLWVRLILAFALVILVVVGAVAILIRQTAETEFRRYITHSGMMATGRGMDELVDYYQRQGSWEGVGNLLGQGVSLGRAGFSPMHDMGARQNRPAGRLDVILAGADGKIIYDSAGTAEGKRLGSRQKTRALPITQPGDGAVIGYLLLSFPSGPGVLGQLEQQFLDHIQQVLIAGAAIAIAVGLVMGVLFSRSLTAPLQRLAGAARGVAAGDLDQWIEAEGSDEMVEVAQSFNEMISALGESERQRQNLVADTAHELRTPLSVVQGNLRAILDDVYPLDKAEISRLYDETHLLSRLIDDLRELALADAGQLYLHLRTTEPAPVMQSTVENLALVADAQGVALNVQIPSELPAVEADSDRVAQVLRNLLVNALRHTPPGGSVTLSAAAQPSAVEFAVTDTGKGIAPEHLPHVFDRFWRADPARARGDLLAGSSGLGLSVAQSLIEAQGGRIWANSQPGEGSAFRFTLPRAQVSP